MPFNKKMEFANYTCRFGDEHVLLDLFKEIVWPAFEQGFSIRTIKDSQYFFVDSQILKHTDGVRNELLLLAGRLVKNTKLKREQVFNDKKGIILSHGELDTAPSSLFVLILNNHRLIYAKEFPGAPDLSVFRTTSEFFIKKRRRQFIDTLFEKMKRATTDEQKTKITKKSLVEKYPLPNIRLTPLTSDQELKDFIEKFRVVKQLTVRVLQTNQDLNNDGFWKEVEHTGEQIESANTKVSFENRKDELDKEGVFAQCKSASSLANSEINIKGIGISGNKLTGNNEDFKLSVEARDLSRKIDLAADDMVSSFLELTDQGAIEVPPTNGNVLEKIYKLREYFGL